jgi:tetratricopeptide (TPR) repeat protein
MSPSVTHPTFRAFISYSHRDMRAAKWLHRRLEAFRIDKDLIGRTTPMGAVPKALRPVFRDRSDFDAGGSLAMQTTQALDNSAAVVVLASPDAARSGYVNEEVRQFRLRHPDRPVIPLIVAGPPHLTGEDVFPRSLRFDLADGGAITDSPTELLAADARRAGDGPDLALAKVVARLLGLAPDEVFRRAERDRRRRNRLRTALGTAMVVLAVAGGFFAWRTHDQGQALAEVEALVRQYQPVGAAQAAPGARENLTAALTAIVQGASRDPRYGRALELLKAGRPEEAEPLLRQSAEDMAARARHDAGQAAAAYRNLGAIAGLADPRRGREAYDKAAAVDPDNIDGLIWAGWFDLDAGDLNGAERWYRRLLSLPDAQRDSEATVWTRLGLGDIAAGRGRLDAALSDYREARAAIDRLAKAEPNNARWQRDLSVLHDRVGDVLLAQGDLPAALQSFRDGLAIADRLGKAPPTTPDGSAISRWRMTASATRWWRRATCRRRCNPSATAWRSATASPRPIPITQHGSAIFPFPTTRSATCCWRRATCRRRCNPSAMVSPSPTTSPGPIPTTPDGSAISLCRTTGSATC